MAHPYGATDNYNGSVDTVLTNYAVGSPDPQFIGPALCPDVKVNEPEGQYPTLSSEYLKLYVSTRGIGEDPKQVPKDAWTWNTYACPERSLRYDIDKEELRTSKIWDLKKYYIDMAKRSLAREKERAIYTALMTASNYATSNKIDLGAAEYFDDSASDPLAIILAGMDAVEDSVGLEPNFMVFTPEAMEDFLQHSVVSTKLTEMKLPPVAKNIPYLFGKTPQELTVLRGAGTYVDDDGNTDKIWADDKVLIAYSAKFAKNKPMRIQDPTIAKCFVPQKYPFAKQGAANMTGDVSFVAWYERWDVKLTNPSAGYLISDTRGS